MPEDQLPDHPAGRPCRSIPLFLPYGGIAAGQPSLQLRGLTVLVVEDSRFACDAARLMLQRLGARMRRAGTLAAARSHLATCRLDVAIVDLGLPDGRGETLLAELRESDTLGIATSGELGGRDAALAAGAAAFLEKPVARIADLARVILDHLPQGDRRRDAAACPGGAVFPDMLAMRDDLAYAAGLLRADPDAVGRRYLAGFIAGVARQARDPALALAAMGARDGDAVPQLSAMIAERMRRTGSGPI